MKPPSEYWMVHLLLLVDSIPIVESGTTKLLFCRQEAHYGPKCLLLAKMRYCSKQGERITLHEDAGIFSASCFCFPSCSLLDRAVANPLLMLGATKNEEDKNQAGRPQATSDRHTVRKKNGPVRTPQIDFRQDNNNGSTLSNLVYRPMYMFAS